MAKRKKQNEEEPKENPDNINSESDDTFGLPEVEYEPLKRDETKEETTETTTESTPEHQATHEYREEFVEPENVQEEIHDEIVEEDPHEYRSAYSYMEEEKPLWPKVLGIALAVIIALGAGYYFAMYRPAQLKAQAEQARIEREAREADARRAESARAEEIARQEAEQRRLDSLATTPKEGAFETLSGRTGRYYVVVASAIDDDLLTDYANKLVKNGASCKVIPPFGKTKFYRLSIDSKETYADAQATADGMKGGDYGDQLWVVRY